MLLAWACAPPDYEEVRSACELAEGEHRPLAWSVADAEPEALSLACVEALGLATGIDWDSLDSNAETARFSGGRGSALVGGLYTLLAADLGTVAALREAVDPAELVVRSPMSWARVSSYGGAEPASRFYWEWLSA